MGRGYRDNQAEEAHECAAPDLMSIRGFLPTSDRLAKSLKISRQAEPETRGSPVYPANKLQGKALIEFFTLEKAVYEVNYELANRPDWVSIPLAGILRVLAKAGGHS